MPAHVMDRLFEIDCVQQYAFEKIPDFDGAVQRYGDELKCIVCT